MITRKQRETNRTLVMLAKLSGCQACGSKAYDTLTFHHRNPADKVDTIASLISVATVSKLQDELAKCDVLCQTCHAALHTRNALVS